MNKNSGHISCAMETYTTTCSRFFRHEDDWCCSVLEMKGPFCGPKDDLRIEKHLPCRGGKKVGIPKAKMAFHIQDIHIY